VKVSLIVCHSDDVEHVPSVPSVYKLLQMHVRIPHMNRLSLVWFPLTRTCSITFYGNIIFDLCLFDLHVIFQEHNQGVNRVLPVLGVFSAFSVPLSLNLSEFCDGCICFRLFKHCGCCNNYCSTEQPSLGFVEKAGHCFSLNVFWKLCETLVM
jgi:hypothetical protein